MTPYEAMLAEALKGKGAPLMSPANPYATNPFQPGTVVPQGYGVSQDFSGQDRDIENQRLQALALQRQSQESPGIIQAGNVAVAGASPLTALAQGLMGWQSGKMNRKADEASGVLSKTMAEQAARKAQLEAEEAAAKDAFEKNKQAALEADKAADNLRADADLARKQAHDKAMENAALLRAQNTGKSGEKLGSTVKAYIMPDGRKVHTRTSSNAIVDATTLEPVSLEGAVEALGEESKQAGLRGLRTDANKIIGLVQSINRFDEHIAPYAEKGEVISNIPGLGQFEKSRGITGQVARLASDVVKNEGSPAQNLGSIMSDIAGAMAVKGAGLSQTKAELERINEKMGVNILDDPSTFIKFADRLKMALKSDIENLKGGVHPEVIQLYNEQTGEGENLFNTDFNRFSVSEGDTPTISTQSATGKVGGKLMVDKDGNKAMVYSDGTIEEM